MNETAFWIMDFSSEVFPPTSKKMAASSLRIALVEMSTIIQLNRSYTLCSALLYRHLKTFLESELKVIHIILNPLVEL